MSSHPEIMPDFLTLEIVKSPSYSDPFSCYFYPLDREKSLNKELVAQDQKPIQLIVPDGTWRQASKVHFRHHELKDVKRVMISTPNISKFHLRAQHRREGMATLQAIAHALGVIEGDLVKDQLLKLYHAKLEQTLIGRGLFSEAKSLA
jgi:DTW domain-containing protein YfiP